MHEILWGDEDGFRDFDLLLATLDELPTATQFVLTDEHGTAPEAMTAEEIRLHFDGWTFPPGFFDEVEHGVIVVHARQAGHFAYHRSGLRTADEKLLDAAIKDYNKAHPDKTREASRGNSFVVYNEVLEQAVCLRDDVNAPITLVRYDVPTGQTTPKWRTAFCPPKRDLFVSSIECSCTGCQETTDIRIAIDHEVGKSPTVTLHTPDGWTAKGRIPPSGECPKHKPVTPPPPL